MKRWKFWVLGWKNQKPTYTEIKSTSQKWPTTLFENLAKRLGFTRLKKDQTIIGGYFVNDNGDCLVCIPYHMDVREAY